MPVRFCTWKSCPVKLQLVLLKIQMIFISVVIIMYSGTDKIYQQNNDNYPLKFIRRKLNH